MKIRLIVVFFVPFFLGGCAIIDAMSFMISGVKGEYYVTPDIHKTIFDAHKPFSKPLAREARVFFIASTKYKDSDDNILTFTNEKNIKNANGQLVIPALVTSKNKKHSIKHSQALSNQAKIFSAKRKYSTATFYRKAAYANAKVEAAVSQINSSISLLQGSVAGLERAIQANHNKEAESIISYLKDVNAVSPKAPKNSVLHIFYFRKAHLQSASPVVMNEINEFVITLKQKNKPPLSSRGTFKYYLIEGDPAKVSNEFETPPESFHVLDTRVGEKKEKLPGSIVEMKFRSVHIYTIVSNLYSLK